MPKDGLRKKQNCIYMRQNVPRSQYEVGEEVCNQVDSDNVCFSTNTRDFVMHYFAGMFFLVWFW